MPSEKFRTLFLRPSHTYSSSTSFDSLVFWFSICGDKRAKFVSSSMKMTFESENQANNDLGQQGDALIPRPALPPRLTTSVQRSPPPHVSNQNIFAVLLKNRRQITSLTAGMNGFLVLRWVSTDLMKFHN